MSRRALRWLDHPRFLRFAELLTRPSGVFLMLHRVADTCDAGGFAPNRPWTIRPGALEAVIRLAQGRGLEGVSMVEALRRISSEGQDPFFCLTFDDGYADNAEVAWPICQRLGVPITVYVTSGLCTGQDAAWWYLLEAAISASNRLSFELEGKSHAWRFDDDAQRTRAFDEAEALLRVASRDARRTVCAELSEVVGEAGTRRIRDLFLDQQSLHSFGREDGVVLASHSVSHASLANCPEDELRFELERSASDLEAITGERPQHFAFPYGGVRDAGEREFEAARAAGYASALTTRHGVVRSGKRPNVYALPRLAVLAEDTDSSLRCKLSGMTTLLHGVRRR